MINETFMMWEQVTNFINSVPGKLYGCYECVNENVSIPLKP